MAILGTLGGAGESAWRPLVAWTLVAAALLISWAGRRRFVPGAGEAIFSAGVSVALLLLYAGRVAESMQASLSATFTSLSAIWLIAVWWVERSSTSASSAAQRRSTDGARPADTPPEEPLWTPMRRAIGAHVALVAALLSIAAAMNDYAADHHHVAATCIALGGFGLLASAASARFGRSFPRQAAAGCFGLLAWVLLPRAWVHDHSGFAMALCFSLALLALTAVIVPILGDVRRRRHAWQTAPQELLRDFRLSGISAVIVLLSAPPAAWLASELPAAWLLAPLCAAISGISMLICEHVSPPPLKREESAGGMKELADRKTQRTASFRPKKTPRERGPNIEMAAPSFIWNRESDFAPLAAASPRAGPFGELGLGLVGVAVALFVYFGLGRSAETLLAACLTSAAFLYALSRLWRRQLEFDPSGLAQAWTTAGRLVPTAHNLANFFVACAFVVAAAAFLRGDQTAEPAWTRWLAFALALLTAVRAACGGSARDAVAACLLSLIAAQTGASLVAPPGREHSASFIFASAALILVLTQAIANIAGRGRNSATPPATYNAYVCGFLPAAVLFSIGLPPLHERAISPLEAAVAVGMAAVAVTVHLLPVRRTVPITDGQP